MAQFVIIIIIIYLEIRSRSENYKLEKSLHSNQRMQRFSNKKNNEENFLVAHKTCNVKQQLSVFVETISIVITNYYYYYFQLQFQMVEIFIETHRNWNN